MPCLPHTYYTLQASGSPRAARALDHHTCMHAYTPSRVYYTPREGYTHVITYQQHKSQLEGQQTSMRMAEE